jgi:hypothetical protein
LDLFQYCGALAAENRNIVNASLLDEMNEFVRSMVEHDYSVDDQSRDCFKFHFVSGYIYAHVAAELVTVRDCEKALQYVTEKWDLFDADL